MRGPRIAPADATTTAATAAAVPLPPVDAFVLSATTRRVLWTLLVALQLANATLLGLFAALYFSRDTPGSLLWTATLYFLFADAYAFVDRFHLVVAAAYALLSAAFAVSALRVVWLSLQRKRLRFDSSARLPRASLVRSRSQFLSVLLTPIASLEWAHKPRWRRVTEWATAVSSAFGVHGPLFDLRFLLDRVVGVATQTIAAYSSSQSISNVELNQTYGIVLFLSCISTPLAARIFRTSRTKRRLAYLLTDLVLDFVWGSIVPTWMHFPIVHAYYASAAHSVNETTTTAREVRRVLVLSWWSLAVSLVPFLTSLVSSLEIQAALSECAVEVPRKPPGPPVSAVTDGKPAHLLHAASAASPKSASRWTTTCRNLVHSAIALYGGAMLVVSLSASDVLGRAAKQPLFPCVFRLHPWFSTKEACVKRFVNCSLVDIEGNRTEIEAALDLFDDGSLSDLHFQSCSALEVPTTLHRFTDLTTIVVEDSWIAEWPLSAAVTSENVVNLKTIKLLSVDTNATLHGLVSAPLAATVEYIRFYDVPNAATILHPVGSNWQHLQYFDCDACDLSDVPLAVDTMYQLFTLSLAESRIAQLRDDWIARWGLQLIGLWMDENEGLAELSDAVWRQAATSTLFSMQYTALSTIPEWVPAIARADFVVYGHGSPLCDENANVLRDASAEVRALVVCEDSEQETDE